MKLEALRPDVITLDVEMPVMDGLTALVEIMRRRPTPVVMLSSRTQRGAETTLRCLEAGAVDFVGKPGGVLALNIPVVAADLIVKIKAAAQARTLPPGIGGGGVRQAPAWSAPVVLEPGQGRALLIGASTGGPRALQTLIPALPATLGVPVVIVQHMPPGFTATLASRLDGVSPLRVKEAAAGDSLEPGVALVAPGGRHLEFDAGHRAVLTDDPPVHGVRPCVDVTLASLVRLFGGGLTAALLTGMGRDGARGLKALRGRGGRTLAEDESTCVIYGMPRAAHELGGVERMLPLPDLADAIVAALRRSP